jgi:CRP-like cAMP-binding protein
MSSLHVLGAGEQKGALPTLRRPAYPGSAAALCRPIVLAIPARGFGQVLRDHPRVAINLLTAAAEVFQDAHARLGEAWRLPVEQGMARTLWRLMRRSGNPRHEGIARDLVLTHRDLASVSGTTQCAVSRALES